MEGNITVGSWNVWGPREVLEMLLVRVIMEGYDMSLARIQPADAKYSGEWKVYWDDYPTHPAWQRMRKLAEAYRRDHGSNTLLNKG